MHVNDMSITVFRVHLIPILVPIRIDNLPGLSPLIGCYAMSDHIDVVNSSSVSVT